jgi:membrane protein
VPLFTITVALMSALPFFEKVMVDIKIFLLLNLVPEIAYKIITVYMEQFAANAARLTMFGLLGVFATALAMLFTIDQSLNIIWRAQRARPFWLNAVGYTMLLAVAPILLGASMSITSYLVSLSLGVTRSVPYADEVLLKFLSICGSTLMFFLVYRIIPCRHVPAGHAVIGGFVAAVLFETMKHLFGIYIAMVPTYDLVYGAFAAIPIFLIWLFLSWMVVLLGAEVAAALAYWKGASWRRAGLAEAELHDGLLVLRALVIAQRADKPVSMAELKGDLAVPIDRLEDILDLLVKQQVIEKLPGMAARYRLVKAADTLSIADAYRLFLLPREAGVQAGEGGELAPLLEEIAATVEYGMQRRLSEVFRPPESTAAIRTEQTETDRSG